MAVMRYHDGPLMDDLLLAAQRCADRFEVFELAGATPPQHPA